MKSILKSFQDEISKCDDIKYICKVYKSKNEKRVNKLLDYLCDSQKLKKIIKIIIDNNIEKSDDVLSIIKSNGKNLKYRGDKNV